MPIITAVLKFYNVTKHYGFLITEEGDLHISYAAAADLEAALSARDTAGKLVVTAEVEMIFDSAKWGMTTKVIKILSVEMPVKLPPERPETFDVFASVKFFDEDGGYGYVYLSEPFVHQTARIGRTSENRSGVIPAKGMPMRVTVEKNEKGFAVLSFESGEEINAAFDAYISDLVTRVKTREVKSIGDSVSEDSSTGVQVDENKRPTVNRRRTKLNEAEELVSTVKLATAAFAGKTPTGLSDAFAQATSKEEADQLH